ncbi:YneF family protein [Paenibacillus sp. GCM10023252]|uniref:YneF family protein n=1 Tax=Paenibacillus sp. GCM10023252 TaxID=3252649 RepID=UPI003607C02E
MWSYIIPIVTLIAGAVGGFFIGVYYLRKQLEKMQNDPEMIQKMAKQMGYNLNKQQMQKAQHMMKNQAHNQRPGRGRR